MSPTDQQVRRAMALYASSVLAKDVDAFMQLYDPELRVFDAWGTWSVEGIDRWRVAIEGWFASLRDDRCRVSFSDVRIVDGDPVAAMSAIVSYEAIDPQGQTIRVMDNRISWTLQMRRNVLRVVHEHTSMPVGFDDAKAIQTRA